MSLASDSLLRRSRYLGASLPGSITYATPNTGRRYCRRFTSGVGTITAVSVYLKQTVANVWGQVWCGVFDDDGGEPGKIRGMYLGDFSQANNVLFNTTAQVARWVDFPISAEISTPANYWAMWWCQDTADITFATDATAGSGTGISGYQTAGGAWVIEKGATGYTWTATNDVDNIIRVFHRS